MARADGPCVVVDTSYIFDPLDHHMPANDFCNHCAYFKTLSCPVVIPSGVMSELSQHVRNPNLKVVVMNTLTPFVVDEDYRSYSRFYHLADILGANIAQEEGRVPLSVNDKHICAYSLKRAREGE